MLSKDTLPWQATAAGHVTRLGIDLGTKRSDKGKITLSCHLRVRRGIRRGGAVATTAARSSGGLRKLWTNRGRAHPTHDHSVTGVTAFPLRFLSNQSMLQDIRDRPIDLPTKQELSQSRVMGRAAWRSYGSCVLPADPVAVERSSFERRAGRLFSRARCPRLAVLAEGALYHRLVIA